MLAKFFQPCIDKFRRFGRGLKRPAPTFEIRSRVTRRSVGKSSSKPSNDSLVNGLLSLLSPMSISNVSMPSTFIARKYSDSAESAKPHSKSMRYSTRPRLKFALVRSGRSPVRHLICQLTSSPLGGRMSPTFTVPSLH